MQFFQSRMDLLKNFQKVPIVAEQKTFGTSEQLPYYSSNLHSMSFTSYLQSMSCTSYWAAISILSDLYVWRTVHRQAGCPLEKLVQLMLLHTPNHIIIHLILHFLDKSQFSKFSTLKWPHFSKLNHIDSDNHITFPTNLMHFWAHYIHINH